MYGTLINNTRVPGTSTVQLSIIVGCILESNVLSTYRRQPRSPRYVRTVHKYIQSSHKNQLIHSALIFVLMCWYRIVPYRTGMV